MITIEQYVGKWADSPDWTQARQDNANNLIFKVNKLMEYMMSQGVEFRINQSTKSQVSGTQFGGFRPQQCPIGAAHSSHKEGLAVDLFDAINDIDNYLMKHQDLLVEYGIYIEHPSKTLSWSHWSIKAPGSGNHVFYP